MTTASTTDPSPLLLARLLTRGPEDSATEVLAELLRQPVLQAAFIHHLDSTVMEAHGSVATQVTNQHAPGRPDLVLERAGLTVMIEAKIGAGFTENQPGGYLEELRRRCADKPGHKTILAILVPERRRHAVWAEVCDLAGCEQTKSFRSNASDRVTMMLTTWTELVLALDSSQPLGPNMKWLLESFNHIVQTHINPEIAHLDEETMEALRQPATIKAAIALTNLVGDLKGRLESLQYATTALRAGATWYGFYATPPNQPELNFWVGYYHVATYELERVEECPLWMQLTGRGFDNDCVRRLNAKGKSVTEVSQHRHWDGWGGRIVALPLGDAVSSDEAIKKAVEELTGILDVAKRRETAT